MKHGSGSMPMCLAQAVGVNGVECKKLYQRLSQFEWAETNTYERISALISVLCDVANVPHSPENVGFAKSIILCLAERGEQPC